MNDTLFKDHFSRVAAGYRTARPRYPAALFEWLANESPDLTLAWDAGCGNGQASIALAAHFQHVVGTDPSSAQIENAERHPRVEYRVECAEAPAFADHGVSLVTVAQAMHWFDLDRFYGQVRRVAKPGAMLAAWTYGLCWITAEVDAIVGRLYSDTLGSYWPPERRHTEDGYSNLPFPFDAVEVPPFAMTATWSLPQFCAYVRTWSSTQRYVVANGHDPVATIEPELAAAWGQPSIAHTVLWPLTVRAGRIG